MEDIKRETPDWKAIWDALRNWKPHLTNAGWWGVDSSFEKLLGSVLVQNTAWTNAYRAIQNLRSQGLNHPEAICKESEGVLVEAVRPAGLYRAKAAAIYRLSCWLHRQGGVEKVSEEIPASDLRNALLSMKGIGPETADMLLLYVFKKPAFIGDTYTRRFLSRYRGIEMNYTEVRESVLSQFQCIKDLRLFHALLVELGKEHCRKKNPRCGGCPMNHCCVYYKDGNWNDSYFTEGETK
ncbi:endonuclease III domain-containing protein [Melghirimyces algeriensis]|uniref:DNA-3-methyladenine glycosylase III n=1 Tax=Melghirimyces algeriensis TaxID=910412 RepID=A0A521BP87_9BACL|nr:hypothetical protein [Melghirimyces algeriensis]SMO48978.1 DNA-3-methyladenine glycosylase III [Melghirimyces algeriensis]